MKNTEPIKSQFSTLLHALETCEHESCDIQPDDFKTFIKDISGYCPNTNETHDISSLKSDTFAALTNSVDVDLLESVLQKFPCNECIACLDKYIENMKKSKYSEHIIPHLEGINCITGIFRKVPNSSDPLCEDIVVKKSFCKAFGISPSSLRLVNCHELEVGIIILGWQIFFPMPGIIDAFQKELSDDDLKSLAPLNLKSLRVEKITLYFYQIKDTTEPTQPVS